MRIIKVKMTIRMTLVVMVTIIIGVKISQAWCGCALMRTMTGMMMINNNIMGIIWNNDDDYGGGGDDADNDYDGRQNVIGMLWIFH